MITRLSYPFDAHYLLRMKKAIRRELISRTDLMEKRVAILGGSTTAEIKDMLELFLLKDGIKPVFYESGYNRYYEEVLFSGAELKQFAPEIIYIHTSNVNITRYPSVLERAEDIDGIVAGEVNRFRKIWDRIAAEYSCPIIQNNFELPHYRGLGNLDAYDVHGHTRFIAELNRCFSEEARQRHNLHLNDINYLSAWFGLERWYDKCAWYSYKYAMSIEAIPLLAHSVATIVRAILGQAKKCLVLDLDNTLWGGIIGDDGVNGIRIGKETPEAEAYTEFQQYVKGLKERGINLAICSKNDEANAREGFTHPDSILALEDFSVFRANWEPKHENIREIAQLLNIGIDSLVFADDNPAERDLIRFQEPRVAVPEMGNNVAKYIDVIDKSGLFETIVLSHDDLQRSTFYIDNAVRRDNQSHFENYDDFLHSLDMVAEIKPIVPVYLDRVAQLTNKTNQFNVTTRRYTPAELKAVAEDSCYITLFGRLKDRFGDNGLVSVMVGVIQGLELYLDLWLMSCRVLQRGMEAAMLDQLVVEAQGRGLKSIIGYYYPSARNVLVSGLFEEMGFKNLTKKEDYSSVWMLDISTAYTNKNLFIEVNK
ncbi:MAG: HAD-IIIC family phosphatase [Nitrosomonas sp.]|nr:HAD-IIIC family phosphatase [Nitrosomonas sp.]MDP1951380.1 HAD-IIIC family phosphatase [Nitrosomonas sp.]